jgi:hypothetical protein
VLLVWGHLSLCWGLGYDYLRLCALRQVTRETGVSVAVDAPEVLVVSWGRGICVLCVVGGSSNSEGTRTRVALHNPHGPCHRGVTTHIPSLNPRMFVRGSLCIRSRCICWGTLLIPPSVACAFLAFATPSCAPGIPPLGIGAIRVAHTAYLCVRWGLHCRVGGALLCGCLL